MNKEDTLERRTRERIGEKKVSCVLLVTHKLHKEKIKQKEKWEHDIKKEKKKLR